MKVTVTPIINGAYVEYDDEENIDKIAYRFSENESLEDATAFLYDIIDFLGLIGSRYSKERIHFDIVHGDKYECSGCDICSKEI
jgi:hypothetical protein